MKLILKNFHLKIQKNYEVFFVILLIIISTIITQLYNESKKIYEKRYINLINNLYFQKTVNHIIEEIQPKFEFIEHRVSQNESLNSIFAENNVSKSEIGLLKKKY